MKRLMMTTALTVAALAAPAWAQTQTPAEHDSHHPSDSAKSEPAPATPAPAAGQPDTNAPQGGMGGMPMMDMMKGMMSNMPMMNMMNMMNMMETMQAAKMMGPGMGGMATIDRVEGRIAFLRAELKITDAQAGAWNAFADALRANAKKLGELRASMMGKSGDAQQPAATMADRLDRQEQWLLARLEGTRAMKAAFAKLNEALSDEQKKTANDILAPHMGVGMMAMMGAQMQPGQMQPGQMGSGKMQPGKMGPGQMQAPGKGN
jgi:hypothetical protein